MATDSITQSCHREHAAERFFVIHQDAEEWFSSGKPGRSAKVDTIGHFDISPDFYLK